jgi:hypothetical protein
MQPFCHAGFVSGQAGRSPSGIRGRLLVAGGVLGAALVLSSAAPAVAAAGTPARPPVAAPKATLRCHLTDPRLPELSGLVVVGNRMLAMNDGGDRLTVYLLDNACRVVDVQSAPIDPYDPEDMAVGKDGTVWLADIGDNSMNRPTIALLAMRPGGASAVYRMTYPDGPHDAEALLLTPDGMPYIVTKELLGSSGVYRPVKPLTQGAPVALGKVSTVHLTLTGTPGGPVGSAGQLMITGGAVAPDGRHFALRTYTDAYVWPLTGSDVAGALTEAPQRIALPASPQGEAISFTANSAQMVVASERVPSDISVVPLSVSRAAAAGPAGSAAARTTGAVSLTDFSRSGLSPITSGLIAVVVATLVVWVGGKLRRRP